MRDFKKKSLLARNIVMSLQFKVIKVFKSKFPNISRYNLVTILEIEIEYSFSLPEPMAWSFQ